MKALPWIVLVLGAGFLIVRQNEARTLATRITTLESRVVQAEGAAARRARGAGRDAPGTPGKTTRDRLTVAENAGGPLSVEDIDLVALAEATQKQRKGQMPDFKLMVKLQRLLLEADAEAIAGLVARTAELEVSDETKKEMTTQFVQMLSQKDPREALEMAFSSPYMNVNETPWAFTSGFKGWLKDEPGAAMAWFDAQIAAGTFESKALDGKSRTRIQFEAAALSRMLGSDPDTARDRLRALPENHRKDVLSQAHLLNVTKETDSAFADLVRTTLPEDQRPSTFSALTRTMVNRGGYERVEEFMDGIAATADERRAIAAQAASAKLQKVGWQNAVPDAGEIDAMRGFLGEHVPEAADVVMGKALAQFTQNGKQFEGTVGIVRDLHAANPSDDLLVGFLHQAQFMQDRETARELAGQIVDPAKREAILEKLAPQSVPQSVPQEP